MNLFKLPLLLVVSLAATVAGCSDKEKEMLKRTNDGTETFVFVPPKRQDVERKEKGPTESLPRPSASARAKRDSDGVDSFKFDPNIQSLPKHKKDEK